MRTEALLDQLVSERVARFERRAVRCFLSHRFLATGVGEAEICIWRCLSTMMYGSENGARTPEERYDADHENAHMVWHETEVDDLRGDKDRPAISVR